MPSYCCVCKRSHENENVSLYSFPKREFKSETACKWKKFAGKESDWNPGYARLCSRHFTDDSFKFNSDPNSNKRQLRPDAIPTIKIPLKKESNSSDQTILSGF